jgi:hypothetical protein
LGDPDFQALRAENIGVNVHYIPIPWLKITEDRIFKANGRLQK